MPPWNVGFFFIVSASYGFSANAMPLCRARLLVPWTPFARPYKSRRGPALQVVLDFGVTFARTILDQLLFFHLHSVNSKTIAGLLKFLSYFIISPTPTNTLKPPLS